MNKEMMKLVGLEKEVKLIEEKKCPLCTTAIKMEDFKDEISKIEYGISGLCQKCQDDLFG